MNDEVVRQWDEVSKDEEVITGKEWEGGKPHLEQVRSAPELVSALTTNDEEGSRKIKDNGDGRLAQRCRRRNKNTTRRKGIQNRRAYGREAWN